MYSVPFSRQECSVQASKVLGREREGVPVLVRAHVFKACSIVDLAAGMPLGHDHGNLRNPGLAGAGGKGADESEFDTPIPMGGSDPHGELRHRFVDERMPRSFLSKKS